MTREQTHYEKIKRFTFHYDSDDSRVPKRRKKARMSAEERRRRHREAVQRHRQSFKGRKWVNDYNRSRYRSVRESEAADTVGNMLARARGEAYQLGWQNAMVCPDIQRHVRAYHDERETWKRNKRRCQGLLRRLLERTRRYYETSVRSHLERNTTTIKLS